MLERILLAESGSNYPVVKFARFDPSSFSEAVQLSVQSNVVSRRVAIRCFSTSDPEIRSIVRTSATCKSSLSAACREGLTTGASSSSTSSRELREVNGEEPLLEMN